MIIMVLLWGGRGWAIHLFRGLVVYSDKKEEDVMGFCKGIVGLGVAVAGVLAGSSAVWAIPTPISGDLFYTKFSGTDRVKKVSFSYDGVSTFTLGTPVTIASTTDGLSGADGIVFDPNDGKILIGAQGPTVHKVNPVGPVVTSASTGGPDAFHLTVEPGETFVWASSIPGVLSRVPIGGSFGTPGTVFTMAGDDTVVTTIIYDDDGDVFYTSSGAGGFGAFGTISFAGTTATTTRLLSAVPAAHGGGFDPFLGDIVLYGDSEITQIDPDTGLVVSTLDLSGWGLQLD